jgi:hypothetical protein
MKTQDEVELLARTIAELRQDAAKLKKENAVLQRALEGTQRERDSYRTRLAELESVKYEEEKSWREYLTKDSAGDESDWRLMEGTRS